jgi:hypothetical protein
MPKPPAQVAPFAGVLGTELAMQFLLASLDAATVTMEALVNTLSTGLECLD